MDTKILDLKLFDIFLRIDKINDLHGKKLNEKKYLQKLTNDR